MWNSLLFAIRLSLPHISLRVAFTTCLPAFLPARLPAFPPARLPAFPPAYQGSTAEWPSLTATERLDLLSAWRSAIDNLKAPLKKPQLLFHAGDTSIAAAQNLARQSKERGADAILIVAPCIMKPGTMDALVDAIGAVAKEAPQLPSIYYHYPELYGVDFKMDEFLEAGLQKIPTLAGVKFIDPDIKTLTAATGVAGGKFTLFNNDPLLAGLAVGSKGAISYTTIFPTVRKMEQAFTAGVLDKARELQRDVFVWDGIVGKFGGKAAARAIPGLFDPRVALGPPRPPLEDITPANLAGLKAALHSAGLLPKKKQ